MADEQPASDLDIRLAILAELRGSFREAASVCDWASVKLRSATTEAERHQIGADLEGFFRRLCLGALALGSPGLAEAGAGGSSVKKETP